MPRQNTIKVSDEEKEHLNEVRKQLFGTDEVPYGVVIARLCRDAN